jgi:hypothetical protein
MSNKVFIAAFSIVLLLFAGCTDYSTERKQVADLMDQLDEAKKVFARSHPDSLEVSDSDIKDRLDIISDHYERNGLLFDMELGLLLGDFKGYRKAFRGLGEKRILIANEMELTYSQLQNLDTDLKNGNLKKDEVVNYMNEERIAAQALIGSIYQLDTLLTRGANGFHKYVPQIDSVMNTFGAPK